MVVARLISRVIDLVTMLILARLLSPADFGLVAIAMTVVLIIEAALELPLSQALVRLPEIKESYYNTAFTLGILRGALLCGSISLIAVPFASFYHHPGLAVLIQVLSIAPAARGLLNPKMAEFAKNMNFKYEFRFELVGKVFAFAVGIAVALLTHSYWSIALCSVTAPVVIALQSYCLVPFRPKLTLVDWRVFSDFLGWISLSQIVFAINWQFDQLLLGKLMRPSQLGLFSTANNITAIPMTALFSPILRPLLSAFTMVRDEPARLRSSYQNAASAVVTIGLPLLVGQSAVAGPTVRLLLGSKWLGAIPMVHWLSLSLVPALFGILMTPLGMALNETKQMLWRNLLQMCVKLPFVIVGAIMYGFAGVIGARLISESVNALLCMLIVRRLIGASVASQMANCQRSIVSTILMGALLSICASWLNFGPGPWMQLTQLTTDVAIGATAYCGSLLMLWRLAGKPPGIEAIFIRMIENFLRRLRRSPIENEIA
jgi:O-antigen/teichoic acid export membrane protein